MSRARAAVSLLCVLLVGLTASKWAQAATRVHALTIGNNAAFPANQTSTRRPDLRYADDDAAAFAELVAHVADSSELLTLMDRETQALYPALATSARVPTPQAVRDAVARLAERVDQRRKAGDRNVVLVFFSGHGALDYREKPALALVGGGIDQDFLYRDIIEKLGADELHILIDACHAEAVVRPRDAEAEAVRVSATEAHQFLVQHTLSRFPHAGAIVAATSTAQAHEWDAIQHGIFTHELLSALRGAADVNRDRRLEYSEVYAFMSAANRNVKDARARLAIVARPPDANRRAVLFQLTDVPATRAGWLSDVGGTRGIVEVEDARGRRLVTLHGDGDYVADLLVPAGADVYVRRGSERAVFRAHPGKAVRFTELAFRPTNVRERGGLEESIRRGLFAAAYGRRYYEGIVDQTPGFLTVDFADAYAEHVPLGDETSFGKRHALLLAAGFSGGIAEVTSVTHGLNLGLRPVWQDGPAASLAALRAGAGALNEWHLRANAGWMWAFGRGPIRGHAGALLGGGLMSQSIAQSTTRRSGFASGGPTFGLTTSLGERLGLWSELDLSAFAYQRDGALALSFLPSAWLGASFRP